MEAELETMGRDALAAEEARVRHELDRDWNAVQSSGTPRC